MFKNLELPEWLKCLFIGIILTVGMFAALAILAILLPILIPVAFGWLISGLIGEWWSNRQYRIAYAAWLAEQHK